MSSANGYKRFAAASLDQTERARDLADKGGVLIMAEAWLDLAEQTTQVVAHEADEAHVIMEQPLRRVSVQGHQPAAD